MLHDRQISEIAKRVAKSQVVKAGLERVVTVPATDSEGNDALRITLVLKPEAAQALTGDAALDLLVELQRELRKKGEERFPIVEYATEQELETERALDAAEGQEEADPHEDDA